MKPIAWYDPTNGAVSTDKDSPLFTPLGQVLPLYTQQEDGGWTPERIAGMARLKAQQNSRLEPVAWFSTLPDGRLSIKIVGKPTEGSWKPLYTAPPQRTWVGLMDEEQSFVYDQVKQIVGGKPFWVKFADAIEAKLKEKNT